MGRPPLEKRHLSMTLVFALPAFQELLDPTAVLEDAREWARHTAVIGNDPDAVDAYMSEHGLEQDLALGDDKWLALTGIRQATHTDRHVFVGNTGDDRRAAEHTGFEYIHVAEAADKAGWTLTADGRARTGPWRRLREWLPVG